MSLLTAWLIACAVIVAGLITAAVVAVIQLGQGGAYLSRHARGSRRRSKRSLPHEMRYHGSATGTWANTRGARLSRLPDEDTVVLDQAPRSHAVDEADPVSQQNRAANRYEDTGEITSADLEALLGPRPAELAGVAA